MSDLFSAAASGRARVGVITHGSLGDGVEMKLDPSRPVETVRAGKFVVVEGERFDFFSLITDLKIEAANENILMNPPAREDEFLRRVMQGSATYATVSLRPQLMIEQGLGGDPQPVKTIPSHFSAVGEATEDDVARVFGSEANDPTRYFPIGSPLDMEEVPVCLDLQRFVERSNAVFGKTGTGKSFLTRLLLCGTIKTGRAVNLIFDMHNEYGFKAMTEGDEVTVPGLSDLFPGRVQVYSIDPSSTRRRGRSADVEVHLYADQVEPADILPLRDTLNLSATATETTFQLQSRYGADWLATLLTADRARLAEIAEETNAHEGSLSALQRKLDRLKGLAFFHLDSVKDRKDVVDLLLESIEMGKSVVLEFGRHNDLLTYLFVANVITRRLRARYEERTETYLNTRNEADKPPQLLITIEEAHKFLGPETARETPFGKIAREMRKFYVSLLIVDQRPSGIDEEVLSQIGTKIVAQLSDEKDIAAALVGTSGSAALRQVLASLDSKQQVLALGHAFPMPVVLRTRSYDADFFASLAGGRPLRQSVDEMETAARELF